jgi:hypothetical protein
MLLGSNIIVFLFTTNPSEIPGRVTNPSAANFDRTTNKLAIAANEVVTNLYGQTIAWI